MREREELTSRAGRRVTRVMFLLENRRHVAHVDRVVSRITDCYGMLSFCIKIIDGRLCMYLYIIGEGKFLSRCCIR